MRVFFLHLHVGLMVAALAGLVYRHRLPASRGLPTYLAFGVLLRVPLILGGPGAHTWGYWLASELICAGLALLLSIELTVLVFGRLPVGRRRSRLIAAAILTLACLTIVLTPSPPTSASSDWVYYQGSLRAAQATYASGLLFVAVVALSSWYRVPLDPLHRDVASGLALWTFLQAQPYLAALDPFLGVGREGLQRLVYTGMLAAWVVAAWRRGPASKLNPMAMRLLQPWRKAAA